jgi:hypothetical protein
MRTLSVSTRPRQGVVTIPKDFTQKIMEVFQTTSFPKFNAHFERLESERRVAGIMSPKKTVKEVGLLCNLVEKLFQE